MKTIKCASGHLAMVDDAMFDKLNQYKWSLSNGYPATRINGKRIRMHEVITGWEMTDHEDRNKLNNQNYNLVETNNQKNGRNSAKPSDNTSGVVGVYWSKANKKWVANITIDYKTNYIGSFTTIDEAKAARLEAELEHFGRTIQ